MNQSRYLPKGFVSSLSKQETNLVNTVAEIAYKRRAAGLPAISRIHSFCLQILKLAAYYTQVKENQKQAANRSPALKKVSRACLDLQVALQAVDPGGIVALMHAANRRNGEAVEFFPKHASICSTHSALVEWLKTQGLENLQKAAVSLTGSRSRGRQPQIAERWTSLEFVRLCHSQGWSNVQVANGGSESKKALHPAPSDAVICLAAVFEVAGASSTHSLTLANTALRSLRKGTQHVVLHTYGPEADAFEEYEQYEISLKASVSESIKLLAELPNFIQKGD